MLKHGLRGLLVALMLAGCSSGGDGGGKDAAAQVRPDTLPPPASDTAAPAAVDGGCDEDVLGEHYCIINSPGGNGSTVSRQLPVDYRTCKL